MDSGTRALTTNAYVFCIPNQVTPIIHALQKSQGSLTFRNVYDTFPSTTRTHLPMATGGVTGTQGAIVSQV